MSFKEKIFGQSVKRIGDSIVFIDGDKAVVWSHVFSRDGGSFQWNRQEKTLVYTCVEDARETTLTKKLARNPLPSIISDGVPRSPWYKWPLILFLTVVLPTLLLVPAFDRATSIFNAVALSPKTSPMLPLHQGPIVLKRDNGWMK